MDECEGRQKMKAQEYRKALELFQSGFLNTVQFDQTRAQTLLSYSLVASLYAQTEFDFYFDNIQV